MIAMQYSFILPADYDMAIIHRRIAEKGHLLDDFPQLDFKAYLSAQRDDESLASRENLYAPFYLWQHEKGMHAFLGGSGFAALTQPSIRTWSVWRAEVAPDLSAATYASRELIAIPPYSALDRLREMESAALQADIDAGALAAVSAYEPTKWTLLRFRLWRELPEHPLAADRQFYRVGHISHPGARH
jgi:hypothetical protein